MFLLFLFFQKILSVMLYLASRLLKDHLAPPQVSVELRIFGGIRNYVYSYIFRDHKSIYIACLFSFTSHIY